MILRCDVVAQYKNLENDIRKSIEHVLRSGRYILGDECRCFEKEFATYCGVKFAIAVANGTEALYLTLRGMEIGEDDEVITSPFTPIPTVSAIVMAGAKPVFVDINADDFLMDVDRLEAAIGRNTKAIIPVHLFGNVVDMGRLLRIAGKHKLWVVEDACQAHGSLYKGLKAGALGDAGCFSFYPTKNLGGYGDGGMIITDNKKLADTFYLLRDYGRDGLFTTKMPGVNSRLDEIQAAILRVKLRYLDRLNSQRKKLADIYFRRLKNTPLGLPVCAEGISHNYHVFAVRCKRMRDTLRAYLEKCGIQTNVYYPISMHLQKAYRYLGYKKGDFPLSENACREVLAIPLYPELKAAAVGMICDTITDFLKDRDK